ncbi:MAG: hypothetical protein ACHQQ3_12335, partial [Gemmatimonadales bacterium]
MLLRDTQRLAALRDIRRYFDRNHGPFAAYNASGSRTSLDTLTEELGTLAHEHEEHRIGARAERAREVRLADELRRKHFRVIVDAQALLEDSLPGLGRIRFPRRRTNSTVLATRARALARALRRHTKVFLEFGLKPDFLARLRADAAALKAAVLAKGAHRGARLRTTHAIADAVSRARHQVRVADAFVRAAVEPGSPLLAEWQALCRAFRRPA